MFHPAAPPVTGRWVSRAGPGMDSSTAVPLQFRAIYNPIPAIGLMTPVEVSNGNGMAQTLLSSG